MLSIKEFSKICNVTTKTLRFYDKKQLITPSYINPENGYRYYEISQLQRMHLILRLKSYQCSLDEIKYILDMPQDDIKHVLYEKKESILRQQAIYTHALQQIEEDIQQVEQGNFFVPHVDDIEVSIVNMKDMHLVYVRDTIKQEDFPHAYQTHFASILSAIKQYNLTICGAPMVMFHDDEFHEKGMDSEFAIPVVEETSITRNFQPKTCLKTSVKGSYTSLQGVYAKQMEYAQQHAYKNTGALFEVYVSDPSQCAREEDYRTEVYYPIKT